MAVQQLETQSVIMPGTSVRVSSGQGQQGWVGVVHALKHDMLCVRLNQWAERPPSAGAQVTVHAQKGGLMVDFVGQIDRYLSDPVPSLLLHVSPMVRTKSLRRSERVPVQVPASYRWYATQQPQPHEKREGQILNIGKGGVALAADHAPETERCLALEFVIPGDVRIDAECVKRYVRRGREANAAFVVGLEFFMIAPHQRKAIDLFTASTLTQRQSPPTEPR